VLTTILIIATVSLVITEIVLVVTLRGVQREIRMMRREIPRLLGTLGLLTMLIEAARMTSAKGLRRGGR
jgi:hypothetical protein